MTTLRIEGMKLQDQVHDNSKVADSNLVLKILSPNQRLNNPPSMLPCLSVHSPVVAFTTLFVTVSSFYFLHLMGNYDH